MSPDRERALVAAFPRLFRGIGGDPSKTSMACECGDGWAELLRATCAQLTAVAPDLVLLRVKEKFGRLRIYIYDDEYPEAVRAILNEAEAESARICEVCGSVDCIGGSRVQCVAIGGWVSTRCARCAVPPTTQAWQA